MFSNYPAQSHLLFALLPVEKSTQLNGSQHLHPSTVRYRCSRETVPSNSSYAKKLQLILPGFLFIFLLRL